jgi:hypothetical protein
LPTHAATLGPDIATGEVDRLLGNSPELPGVIVATAGRLLGMISRETLLAHLSRPFGQDIYLKRPIRLMLEALAADPDQSGW